MPYTLLWYADDAIHLKITGDYTRAEMIETSERIRDEFLAVSSITLYLIVDVQEMITHPTNLTVIIKGVRAFIHHPNMGALIFTGKIKPISRFVAIVVSQVAGVHGEIVDTLEEAAASLHSLREKTTSTKPK